MSKWLLSVFFLILGGALVATEVDARRLGGGRALGTQRSVTAPPAKPAQQQASPAKQQGSQQAAPQGSRWGGILGGLALGGLLGYLFAGNGMGGLLLLALLAIVAVLAVRALARRRTQEAPRPVQFAGMGHQAVVVAPPSPATGVTPARNSLPAGFDAAGFLKGAKLNFVKLQMANDAGELDEIREFTTNELFEELKKDVLARSAQGQQTDVVNLDADLLELTTEQDRHWASVRFSGMVREAAAAEPAAFEEVWNLVKPADGSSGWLLAGIQQMR
jgi:predicted lipid-binding transport protein (Tim44 family)